MGHKLTRRGFLTLAAGASLYLAGCALPVGNGITAETNDIFRATPLDPEEVEGETLTRSEDEWRALLSPLQFYVMRQKGTERAFTGEYDSHKADGTYHCSACGNPLFGSEAKYDSGTGWPSFWAPLSESYVVTERDVTLGMVRTEVLCARCGSHLGHVFKDGPQPTGLRYCINSVALNFNPTTDKDTSSDDSTKRGMATMAEGEMILAFSNSREAAQWVRVNDTVMGGLSESNLVFTEHGTAVFEGHVSLENYGGFASVRTRPQLLGLGGYEGLLLRVKGDGKRYKLRLRTDAAYDGPAYESSFATVAGEWIEVRVPFSACEATFRGYRVRNAPDLEPAKIQQIGFMIADKQEGQFRLELAWVRAY